MSGTDYKFFGWLGKDKDCVHGKMVWEEYTPKTWTEDDVDIKVTHCGICASDLHTLRSGWGPSDYPVCVGHEIVGIIVRLGKNVTHLKLGDRVGVGAQSGSCLHCEWCNKGEESYCDAGQIGTYNGRYSDKSKSYGGYSDYARLPAHFAFKLPDGLSSEVAAPMMCGGVTVYSPLKFNGAGTTAKKVGIVGVGGLGHFGIMFAAALGAEVYAISRSDAKKEDAIKMGAKHFIATGSDPKAACLPYRRQLDLIICTLNDEHMPLGAYISLLRPRTGKFVMVGAPEKPIPVVIFDFLMNGAWMGGSAIGGSHDINEMLELAAKQNIKSWVQTRPLTEANQAVLDMDAGKARFRYVLVNEKNLKSL